LVTIDSARTQALIGFVRSNDVQLSNLAAAPENNFCTLQIASLDGRPIRNSSLMLLVAGGVVRNTGQQWNTAGTDVTAWGGSPTLIEPVTGTITLRQIDGAKAVKLQALDGAGQPLGKAISATLAKGGWSLPLGNIVTSWYVITVSR
jgi:hypothetical protein